MAGVWGDLTDLVRRRVGFRRLLTVRLVSQTGDGTFQAGLASLLFLNPQTQTDAVTALWSGGSTDQARRAVHSLRGASATFGANTFADLLRQMESDCDADETDKVLAALDDFQKLATRYRAGLTAMREEIRAMT